MLVFSVLLQLMLVVLRIATSLGSMSSVKLAFVICCAVAKPYACPAMTFFRLWFTAAAAFKKLIMLRFVTVLLM